MNLRVWHIPQVPGKAFHVPVNNITEAVIVLMTLSEYDEFQLENNIKPDYCNANGLECFIEGEWREWMDLDGDEIDRYELVGSVAKK